MKTTLPYQSVISPHHRPLLESGKVYTCHRRPPCILIVFVFVEQEHHVDQLLKPKHFPGPVLQYTLKELTIVWHLYGGHDFTPHPFTPSPASSPHLPHRTPTTPVPSSSQRPPSSVSSRAGTTPSSSHGSPTYTWSRSSLAGGKGGGRGGRGRGGWSFSGGPGRDHSVHMEVEVDKVYTAYLP